MHIMLIVIHIQLNIDKIFPYIVKEVLSDKKGFSGIFLTCVFSGSLSRIWSGLNSLSAVIISKGLMNRQLSDERQGFIWKLLWILVILNQYLSLFGVLSGPIMGLFFPQANNPGALIEFVISLFFQLWIVLVAQINKKQMKNVRLTSSIVNCSIPINITTTPINLIPND